MTAAHAPNTPQDNDRAIMHNIAFLLVSNNFTDVPNLGLSSELDAADFEGGLFGFEGKYTANKRNKAVDVEASTTKYHQIFILSSSLVGKCCSFDLK